MKLNVASSNENAGEFIQMVVPLRQRLKEQTQKEHKDLEDALDLMADDFSLEDYRRVLTHFFQFYSAFEFLMLQLKSELPAAAFVESRKRSEWLREDLSYLGYETPVHDLRYLDDLSYLNSQARLLGALYVNEGSTLGGVILARHFSRKFGLSTKQGVRFFEGYGDQTANQWRAFLQYLSEEESSVDGDEVVASAKFIFSLTQKILVG